MAESESSNWRQSDNWRSLGPSRSDSGPAWRGTKDQGSPAASRQQQKQRPSEQHKQRQFVGGGQAEESRDSPDDSISQGRRIYLGNLLYRVKPDEIEEMLAANGFEDQLEAIHISVDAVTARNPGYCFVDFNSRDAANNALQSLDGVKIEARPVKVGPCRPKGAEKRWKSEDYQPTFQRWGDWSGSRREASRRDGAAPPHGQEQGPYGALDHLQKARQKDAPPRVYFGGIGKMVNQEEHDKEIRGHLEGFKIIAISKRITPHLSTRAKSGNHHYCFVDFETTEEAEAAIKALNGRVVFPDARLRLQMAGRLPNVLQ